MNPTPVKPTVPPLKPEGKDPVLFKPTPSAVADIEAIQKILQRTSPGLAIDGDVGNRTRGALAVLDELGDEESAKDHSNDEKPKLVKASSFADPKDLAGFNACKLAGGTDLACFAKGDNGLGKWGHKTAQDEVPMAALPREVWRNAGKSGGALINVTYKGETVQGILADTMPALANIKNGAGIDLNPAFAKRFGLKPPFLVEGVSWDWA